MECSSRWRLTDLFGYNFLSSCYTFHYSSRLPGAFTKMSEFNNPTARTRVVREPHRGVYDRAEAYKILDEGFICHLEFRPATDATATICTSTAQRRAACCETWTKASQFASQ